MISFSLWEERWIPVQMTDGAVQKLGLLGVLTGAHRIRGIADPSPLVTVGLHRLLLALIYRTHPLDGFREWCSIWQSGRFHGRAIEDYGERMDGRFDLVHPTRPFYQVPSLPEEKEHPVAGLLLEAAHGNNPTLFDHGLVEGARDLPLDRAACYLVALQLFAIGGGVSKPFNRMDAPLTKGIVVEVTGATLFETLMLNAIPMDRWEPLAPPTPADAPFWEVEVPPLPVKGGTPVSGPLQYLTWQSRRVQMLVDLNRSVVTGCKIAQRYCLPKNGVKLDLGKAYRRDEDDGWVPYRLQKDRAAWRLTHVLLQPTLDGTARPEVVSWLSAVRRHERWGDLRLPSSVSLAVSGLTTDPMRAAKIDLWRREEMGLPLAILEEPERLRHVERMLTVASRVESHLIRTGEALVWSMAERGHQADALQYLRTGKRRTMPPTVPSTASSLGLALRYWSVIEAPFREALWGLATQEPDAVWAEWLAELRHTALAAVESTVAALRAGGTAWEPLSRVQDAFTRRLGWYLKNGMAGDEDDESAEGTAQE